MGFLCIHGKPVLHTHTYNQYTNNMSSCVCVSVLHNVIIESYYNRVVNQLSLNSRNCIFRPDCQFKTKAATASASAAAAVDDDNDDGDCCCCEG